MIRSLIHRLADIGFGMPIDVSVYGPSLIEGYRGKAPRLYFRLVDPGPATVATAAEAITGALLRGTPPGSTAVFHKVTVQLKDAKPHRATYLGVDLVGLLSGHDGRVYGQGSLVARSWAAAQEIAELKGLSVVDRSIITAYRSNWWPFLPRKDQELNASDSLRTYEDDYVLTTRWVGGPSMEVKHTSTRLALPVRNLGVGIHSYWEIEPAAELFRT